MSRTPDVEYGAIVADQTWTVIKDRRQRSASTGEEPLKTDGVKVTLGRNQSARRVHAAPHRPPVLAGHPLADSGTSPSLQKLDQAIQEGNEKTEIVDAINMSKPEVDNSPQMERSPKPEGHQQQPHICDLQDVYKIVETGGKFKKLEAQIGILAAKNEAQDTIISHNTEANKKLNCKVQHLEANVGELRSACSRLEKENKDLKKVLKEKNEEIEKLQLQRDLEKSRNEVASLKREILEDKLAREIQSKNEVEEKLRVQSENLASLKKKYEDRVTCSICQKIFVRPQMSQCGHTYCATCWESSLGTTKGKCPQRCSGYPNPLVDVKGMTADIQETLRDQEQWRQQEADLSGCSGIPVAVQDTSTLDSEREGATVAEAVGYQSMPGAVGGTDTQGAVGFTYENVPEAVKHAETPKAKESSDSDEPDLK